MRPEFASARFPCCPKIYSRLWGPSLLCETFLLRCEGRHESFTGVEREVRSVVYGQRRAKESARPPDGTIAGRAAERPGIDWDERRMRRRRMRFVFRTAGRHAGE